MVDKSNLWRKFYAFIQVDWTIKSFEKVFEINVMSQQRDNKVQLICCLKNTFGVFDNVIYLVWFSFNETTPLFDKNRSKSHIKKTGHHAVLFTVI